ncbi:SDR family NAD(P)-dependent oxidoreductase [Paraburkholderia sp.]|jgi:3-oxoacyl-[acyl-carrier protein] reductase|uniref:SDR family NAD(P)-dependent oxidoreductase n=1 Tax=Paraburkholderia sp. TaxID=1926495 RepID=UPI003C31EDCA
MELELKDKRVLITGGSRGIGFSCAETFLREGCRVTLVGSKGIEQLASHLDEVDILVNNAGAIPGGGLASARASYLSGVVIDADGGGRYAAH